MSRRSFVVLLVALVLLAGCSTLGREADPPTSSARSPSPPSTTPSDGTATGTPGREVYAVGPTSPPCPGHGDGDGDDHYPPTSRREFETDATWRTNGEAVAVARQALNGTRRSPDRDLGLEVEGRYGAVNWLGTVVDVEERYDPRRSVVLRAPDYTDLYVLVLGYEDRTILVTYFTAGYC